MNNHDLVFKTGSKSISFAGLIQESINMTLKKKTPNCLRLGCRDIWNAHMAKDALFCAMDIPFCPTTAKSVPKRIITWEKAKAIYKQNVKSNTSNFKYEAYVCFYVDDYKFDGIQGVWHACKQALRILRHFSGAITPDFSTYQDFPEPIKLYATYRMRLLGYWWGKNGIAVINNVRWGTRETWKYSFSGIPKNSMVSIGTVGGSPRKLTDRKRFEEGLNRLVEELHPHTIIVYGSANYPCFDRLRANGIRIISFQSQTAQAFEGRFQK